jgi:ATP-dependent Lon protease
MEVINLPGYVHQEKVHIVRKHLLPRVLLAHGLKKTNLKLKPAALNTIIGQYTREAGVRNLERQLSMIARKVGRKIVEDVDVSEIETSSADPKTAETHSEPVEKSRKKQKREKAVPADDRGTGDALSQRLSETSVVIGAADLPDYLGAPKRFDTGIPKVPSKGLVLGLAWTESGGDVLVIEVATMKGKGNILLTGNLGDVMKESARTAISYLRSRAADFSLADVQWDELDIHLHVPEGAVPKDGPSAGVTMATGILSALSGRVVRNDVAMTGEISLLGKVLPVGGIREKMLAARRYGINSVILPEANRVDVDEIPSWAVKDMTFHYAEEAPDVFSLIYLQ